MIKKFTIPIFIILIGILAVGCSSGKLSSSSNTEGALNEEKQLKVETKVISDDREEIESNIALPIFSDGNNEELLKEINSTFEQNALFVKEELMEMSKNDFENAKKENIDFRKYELLVNYEVHTMSNELISATTLTYQYTGGAHGLSVKVPYNFDLITEKEIILSDLFKDESNYRKVINEEIQKQIKEHPDEFYPDEVAVFSGIGENQGFYIKDGKLVIYFGQYDIAPYSSGIIEFEIPRNILNDDISSSFIK